MTAIIIWAAACMGFWLGRKKSLDEASLFAVCALLAVLCALAEGLAQLVMFAAEVTP